MTPGAPQRTVRATPRFLKSKRSMNEEVQLEIDERVKAVISDPLLGEPKTGTLRGVRVVKFKLGPRQYLLAYNFAPKTNVIEVLDVGVHENFYRDLQNYVDARPK
jgi:mRNA-degrading endonuclease RelE of RelBE toxin-antitoxin system